MEPNTWARHPDAGAKAAAAYFPQLNANWLAKKVTLMPALWSEVSDLFSLEDFEDVLQRIVLNETRSSATKGGQLYEVGSRLTNPPPWKQAVQWMAVHLKHRNRQPKIPVRYNPEVTVDQIARWAQNPEAWVWLNSLAEQLGTSPLKIKILDLFLSEPDMNLTDIAVALDMPKNTISGKSDPNYVSRVVLQFKDLVEKQVREDNLPDFLTLSDVGFGRVGKNKVLTEARFTEAIRAGEAAIRGLVADQTPRGRIVKQIQGLLEVFRNLGMEDEDYLLMSKMHMDGELWGYLRDFDNQMARLLTT